MTPEDRAAIRSRHMPCGPGHKYRGCFAHFFDREHCAVDADNWPCDAIRLLDALETGLDVERLARALHDCLMCRYDSPAAADADECVCDSDAEAIARAYAVMAP